MKVIKLRQNVYQISLDNKKVFVIKASNVKEAIEKAKSMK